jgi:predicted metal-dependent hydrolase
MPSFKYGTTIIDYKLIRNPQTESVSIAVEWQNGVTITAPNSLPIDTINSTLYKKGTWILNKWYEVNEILEAPMPKEYVSGEKFAYLGRHYKLKVHKEDALKMTSVKLYRGRFLAYVPKNLSAKEQRDELYLAFKKWYILHGQTKVQERQNLYQQIMDVTALKVALKEQRMRWGTCTKEGAIYLNWRIVMAPVSVLDYVLVHELAHIKYPDHSNEFWRFVQSILPDFEQRKEWLRINGPKLSVD